jgi:hypothetical protein
MSQPERSLQLDDNPTWPLSGRVRVALRGAAHLASTRATALVMAASTVTLFWLGACFVYNHFLLGPYLLDSGWYSAIIHEQGLLPLNPPMAHPLRDYYGIHFSVLISLGSLLSHAIPLDRVSYYCLFQGLMYAPLGCVTALLLSGRQFLPGSQPGARAADALLILVASLIFALNGQVLACLGYPHYEIFLSAGLCLLLAGLATGKARVAWCGLVIAAITREDGGLHAAAFAGAALLCSWTKKPWGLPQKALLTLCLVGIASSAFAIVLQKTCFVTANLFKHEYLGDPPYAHIDAGVLQERLLAFAKKCRFILFPLLGSAAIAVLKRDARYLLGWLVEGPWLLVNFLAAQELKSRFEIYTGFPFVGSIFWIGAYARVTAPAKQGRAWLAPLVVVSALSSLGLEMSNSGSVKRILTQAAWPVDVAYEPIASFASRLERDPNAHGYLFVDHAMAAWTVQGMPPARKVDDLRDIVSFHGRDGIVFYRRSWLGRYIARFIAKSPFTNCGRIPDTQVYACLRPERTLPPEFVVAALVE